MSVIDISGRRGSGNPTAKARLNAATIISRIRQALDVHHGLRRAYPNDEASAAAQWLAELRTEAAALFGRLNGWTLTDRDVGQDSTLTAPTLWYEQSGECSAIVRQPLRNASDAAARELAEANGLVCHIPPRPCASFHFPRVTKFFVFTRPGHRIAWLPEQNGGSDGQHI
jgi:hypothetical protein